MPGRVYLEHEDNELHVEYDAPPPAKARPSVKVDEDTLVQRPDLGPRATTLVAAGDRVPSALAGFPRGPFARDVDERPRCGAERRNGAPCQAVVPRDGERCHRHRKPPSDRMLARRRRRQRVIPPPE